MLRKIAHFPVKIGRLKICLNVKCFVKGDFYEFRK